jgi:hypothetical protein
LVGLLSCGETARRCACAGSDEEILAADQEIQDGNIEEDGDGEEERKKAWLNWMDRGLSRVAEMRSGSWCFFTATARTATT